MDRFPLYTHQEEALLASFSDAPNLLVATGTGSGKTEAFVLPILARILQEATGWASPRDSGSAGFYNPDDGKWEHARRHETREAGVRAIVLYPMNALVNDQMSRLRRVLSLNGSPDWQRQRLQGNVIHFGMYTSLTPPTRGPDQSAKREEFEVYLRRLAEEWESLSDELRSTGNWPAVGGPEMLCRWDMQTAPPDILVTNYSMLEYMLIRPIEAPIFDATRAWLEGGDDRAITLVLDEAHTYTGAKGTEVAHLVRRLKERLGIRPGSNKFRAIATSASIPNAQGAEGDLLRFTSDLFGEPQDTFTLVHAGVQDQKPQERDSGSRSLTAFAKFHDTFSHGDPWPSMDSLAQSLGARRSQSRRGCPSRFAPTVVRQRRPAVGEGENGSERNAAVRTGPRVLAGSGAGDPRAGGQQQDYSLREASRAPCRCRTRRQSCRCGCTSFSGASQGCGHA